MSGVVELMLPCGIDLENGRVERRVTMQKMRGKAQRDLQDFTKKKQQNITPLIEEILRQVVVSVGDKPINNDHLLKLYVADRDWLLFESKKMSTNLIEVVDVCTHPGCGEKTVVPAVDLNTLEVTPVTDDASWWGGDRLYAAAEVAGMQHAERSVLERRAFEIKDEKLGASAVFSYPRGRHQRDIGHLADKEVEAIWMLMSLTCLSWVDPDHNEQFKPGSLPPRFWDNVDMDVLTWAQKAYADAMPGVNSRIEVECPAGHTFSTILQAVTFLLPQATQTS